MDAVEQASSGHPSMPIGMADAAHVLWTRFLELDPADPEWLGRDRCVLETRARFAGVWRAPLSRVVARLRHALGRASVPQPELRIDLEAPDPR